MINRLHKFRVVANSYRNTNNFVRLLNEMIDMINAHSEILDGQSSIANSTSSNRRTSTRTASLPASSAETVKIGNDTGGRLGIYHAVRIDMPLDGRNKAKAVNAYHRRGYDFKGEKPGGGDEVFAVTLAPSDRGGVVPARIVGIIGMIVDVTNKDHRYATTVEGDTAKLVSASSGYARILNQTPETGEQFCMLLLGASAPVSIHVGIVAEGRPINYGLDPEDDLHGGYVRESGGEPQRAFAGMLAPDESISEGRRVEWLKIDGINRIINAECEP